MKQPLYPWTEKQPIYYQYIRKVVDATKETPVSLASVPCKIMENIIKEGLSKYLLTNKIPSQ